MAVSLVVAPAVASAAGASTPQTASGDWSQLSPGNSPPARSDAASAYDPATGQLVVFGGYGSNETALGDTWVWDGTDWTQQTPAHSPSARQAAVMAFDPATRQLVLFGGYDSFPNPLNDTWVWNGTDWIQQIPAHSPPVRDGASMAYDPGSGQLVLFGGVNNTENTTPVVFNDTWTWNGTDWTQQSPTHSPSAREAASMAYDPGTAQLVLFGGMDSNYVALADTWVWNGTDWIQQSPTDKPPARSDAATAYDPGTGQLVLFGGVDDNLDALADTWAWNGTDWTQQNPAQIPSARSGAAMAYDPGTAQLVLYGGVTGSILSRLTALQDTWAYTPAASIAADWGLQSPTDSPSGRADAAAAYDPGTGQLVLFGGIVGEGRVGDTWVWNGTDWSQQNPANSPSDRSGAAMAYDPGTGQLLLFGGFDGDTASVDNDTWVWNGTDWTQLNPADSPPGRQGASMGYDPVTGQLILFGGFGSSSALADTWTWDGQDWTQETPTVTPSARGYAAMAYQPGTGQLVLFGGEAGSNTFGDTWVWNGSEWAQQSPTHSPPARSDASMAYDPGLGQVVLFGGYDDSGSNQLADTWAWDGRDWTQQNPAESPPPSGGAAMAYDPGTGQLVLFGGISSTYGYLGLTAVYGKFLQPQAVSFTSTPPSNPTVGGHYVLTASGGGSGNPVTFAIDPSTTNNACTLEADGHTVDFVNAGTCVVDANQPGNDEYSAATQSQSMTVAAAPAPPSPTSQSIEFTSTPPANPTVGGHYVLTASGGGSGNPVTFAIDPSTTNNACTLEADGHTVDFNHAGTCVIDANQAGNNDYSAATRSQTVTIGKASQQISFTSTPPANPTVGGHYVPTASGGGSGNPVTFTIDPSTTNQACTLDADGHTVDFDHVGTCVIDANQAGNADYAASTVKQTVRIGPAPVAPILVAAKGRHGHVEIAGDGLKPGWHTLGFRTVATPAVAAVPSTSPKPASPLLIAVGRNHRLYERGLTGHWKRLANHRCWGSPAALALGHRVQVACHGPHRHLFTGSARLRGGTLPRIHRFRNLGGKLRGGPALADWHGKLTFFVTTTNHRLAERTLHSGYRTTSLRCVSQPVAGNTVKGRNATVGCVSWHRRLVAVTAAAGFRKRIKLGGPVVGVPGIAVTTAGTSYFAQRRNHHLYTRTAATRWHKLGGYLTGGVQAIGLT